MTVLGMGSALLTINAISVVNPISTDTSTRSALLGMSVRASPIAAALLRKERTAILKSATDAKPIGNFDDVSVLLEVMPKCKMA